MNNIKKLLFIIPPYFALDEYKNDNDPATKKPVFTTPYGIMSISEYICKYAKYDVKVDILDLNLYGYKISCNNQDFNTEAVKLIKDRINLFKPDFIGISALFNTCYNYLELISSTVKMVDEKVFLFVGGGLATNLYKEVLGDFKYIDAACFGEGEIPVKELIDCKNIEEFLRKDNAWINRYKIEENIRPIAQFVENLDDIPFFNYDLIDLKIYTGRSLDKEYSKNSVRELSIHTSRGCPFSCVFCSNGTVHGKKVRYMSVEKVLAEVERMVKVYSIDVLLIEDDHFLSDKERAKKILQELVKLNIRLEFPNGIAVYAIDEEIGMLLRKAGATAVPLAVESGSDYVLKNIINKPLKVSMIKTAVNILRKNNIKVHAFMVVGLPGETQEHRNETMHMIEDVGFDWVYFFLSIPIAGSRLYDICKENNYLIDEDFSKYNTTKCNIRIPGVDPKEMEDVVYLMNLEANFVKNYNMLNKNYDRALNYFESIAQRYKDHAFVYYCLVKILEETTRDKDVINRYKNRYYEIVETNNNWKKYESIFNLSI